VLSFISHHTGVSPKNADFKKRCKGNDFLFIVQKDFNFLIISTQQITNVIETQGHKLQNYIGKGVQSLFYPHQ